jgi:hypothetical protein
VRSGAGVEIRIVDRADAIDDVEGAGDQQKDRREYDSSSTSHL